MTSDVPTQAVRIPALSGNRDGNDVKNPQPSLSAPSIARSTIRAANVSIPTKVEIRPTTANMASICFRRATLLSMSSIILINLPVAFSKQVPTDIKEDSHTHERKSCREHALIGDRPVRKVSQTHLNDVRREGSRTF